MIPTHKIFQIACEIAIVKPGELLLKTRKHRITNARYLLLFLMMNYTRLSVHQMAELFGRHYDVIIKARKSLYIKMNGRYKSEHDMALMEMINDAVNYVNGNEHFLHEVN